MNLLDVIGELLRIFVDLIPRVSPRPKSTEWLVVDAFGLPPHAAWSRPVIIWPIFDHVEYWPRTEHPIDLSIQSLTTDDGVSVTVNPEAGFRIKDPLVTRPLWGDDYVHLTTMVVRGAVVEAYSSYTWEEARKLPHDKIAEAAIDELDYHGVELSRFCVEEQSAAIPLRHFNN